MSRESFNSAYAYAFGILHGYLNSASHESKHEATSEDCKETIRKAHEFATLFSAMTPDVKAAWFDGGCRALQAPKPAVPATPLPGLVTGEEIQACLRRAG